MPTQWMAKEPCEPMVNGTKERSKRNERKLIIHSSFVILKRWSTELPCNIVYVHAPAWVNEMKKNIVDWCIGEPNSRKKGENEERKTNHVWSAIHNITNNGIIIIINTKPNKWITRISIAYSITRYSYGYPKNIKK